MSIEDDLDRAAREYRSEGYVVVPKPDRQLLGDLPGSLSDLLYATRGGEKVVVQVKQTRDDLADDPTLLELAEQVNARPGWRYDLVISHRADPFRRLTRHSREPSHDEIMRTLVDAESRADAGWRKEALVTAWGALDAVMRQSVTALEFRGSRLESLALLGTLYSSGPLSLEHYDRLKHNLYLRDGIIHGLVPPEITADMVRDVTTAARDLLAYNPEVEAVAG